jgi:hypothetical protein
MLHNMLERELIKTSPCFTHLCEINNPFAMRVRLGPEYTAAVRGTYAGRVPGGADLICYWFEKARARVEVLKTLRVGLVATNAIRRGANRVALDRIAATANLFSA